MSGLPQPELHKDAKFVFLSDWDGTITDKDSNDYLVDHLGFGAEERIYVQGESLTSSKRHNDKVLSGEFHFRDSFKDMLESVSANGHSFEECKQVLRDNIRLDPGFLPFYRWCKERGIPVIIVSSGMAPIIRAVLEQSATPAEAAEIEIIANDVVYTDEQRTGAQWDIVFRHPESGFGHDKSLSITPYRAIPSRPTLFFAGDGVSDLSAARHADLLFTKTLPSGADSDLIKYCQREGITHVKFGHFDEVTRMVKEVVEGGKTAAAVAEENQ